jgi:hypothetical protein
LEEAIADCFGLLLLHAPTCEGSGFREDLAVGCFLGELLRYLLRGGTLFEDSAAAFLELSYLVTHGHIQLDHDRLLADPQDVTRGIRALCQELMRVVFHDGPNAARCFLSQHTNQSNPDNARVLAFVTRMAERSKDIPIDVALSFHT